MKSIIIVSLFSLFGTVLFSQTKVQFSNCTAETIYVCYAKWENSWEGWTTRGWYAINGYSQKTLDIGNYEGYIYTFAENDNGVKWTGNNATLCINRPNAFTFPNSDKSACNTRESFDAYYVSPGCNIYRFTY